MHRLSIVTVCKNERNIKETCESVVAQTRQDFEWIVIDGGSDDLQTLETIEKYKDRINVFISEKDNGIYDAMNKGIKLAKGEYINFLNGGDSFLSKDTLEKVFSKEYSSDVLYGDAFFVYDKCMRKMSFPKNLTKEFFYDSCLAHSSAFIKTSLFEKYGPYNEANKIVSDWEKWIEFIVSGVRFEHIDVTVSKYDMSGISSVYDKDHHDERERVLWRLYTPYELEEYKNRPRFTPKYFFASPILKLYKKRGADDHRLKFFGYIPFLKIVNRKAFCTVFLFNLIPVLKFKMKTDLWVNCGDLPDISIDQKELITIEPAASRSIWLDVTTTLGWKRAAVGIVRVEAETIRYFLSVGEGKVRFCQFDRKSGCYTEVSRDFVMSALARLDAGGGKAQSFLQPNRNNWPAGFSRNALRSYPVLKGDAAERNPL